MQQTTNLVEQSLAPNPQDTLRVLLTQIELRCQEWDIHPFYGLIGEEAPPMTLWQKDNGAERDWEAFLRVFKGSGAPILHIATYPYSFPLAPIEAFIHQELPLWEEWEQQEFLLAYESLKGKEHHLACFDLLFQSQGVYYRYEALADWYDNYALVSRVLLDGEQANENEADEDEGDEEALRVTLSGEQIDGAARRLIAHPLYVESKNITPHFTTLTGILKTEGIEGFADVVEIALRAQAIYQKEVQPRREQELIGAIQELKKQGCTKTAIMASLGIGRITLERYFNREP